MVVFKVVPCGGSGGGSTSGGGGSSSGSFSGTTSPNIKTPLFTFISSLSPEQREWWADVQNISIKIPMIAFLNKNSNSEESEDFVVELINFALANSNSPEAIEEIKNVLDILDDGLINAQPVVVAPDLPITNMADYLNCFDTSQPATITIYADQPKAGTHNLTSSSDGVGHAFISIRQGTKVKTLGFYPQSSSSSAVPNPLTIQPNDFSSTPGVFGNDQQHSYDVSITVPITATQLSNTITGIISVAQNNPSYNLGSMNCTDSAIIIFESNTNINIPSCESPRLYWSGQTPGTLGQVIRTITLPAGATRNTTGGTAPLNSSN